MLLPLTLMSGIYGMNFQHIPFSADYHGFVTMVGVMLGLAITMLGFFRWKRWI